jgi:hypothetical protein
MSTEETIAALRAKAAEREAQGRKWEILANREMAASQALLDAIVLLRNGATENATEAAPATVEKD